MFPLKDNIPNDRFPLVTVALIVANVIVYLISISHGGSFFGGPADAVAVHYGAIPYEFTHWGKHCDLLTGPNVPPGITVCQVTSHIGLLSTGETIPIMGQPHSQPATWETAFSSMFMHGGLLHILFNMLFLWIFGANVEDAMGRPRFFVFYILGGFAALAGQILVQPNSTVPTIGASGAIAAVLGGYILLYPRARILTLVFIVFFITVIELPAFVMIGLWFLEQLLFGIANATNPVGGGGGVAYFAHVGGFIFGLALVNVFAKRRKQIEPRLPVY